MRSLNKVGLDYGEAFTLANLCFPFGDLDYEIYRNSEVIREYIMTHSKVVVAGVRGYSSRYCHEHEQKKNELERYKDRLLKIWDPYHDLAVR